MVGVVRALIHSSVLPFAVSALLTSIAVGSYGWYVVNAARYQVAYGAFYSKGCSGSYCQTDYMQCLGAWYCLALGVFRVFGFIYSRITCYILLRGVSAQEVNVQKLSSPSSSRIPQHFDYLLFSIQCFHLICGISKSSRT
ncbi:hypothetical protein BDR26DRAFT_878989 [Obelidium mucronatum]|nr:hypothetical protein BDR26DRAFT_878989 [Obelidium mucronatum]